MTGAASTSRCANNITRHAARSDSHVADVSSKLPLAVPTFDSAAAKAFSLGLLAAFVCLVASIVATPGIRSHLHGYLDRLASRGEEGAAARRAPVPSVILLWVWVSKRGGRQSRQRTLRGRGATVGRVVRVGEEAHTEPLSATHPPPCARPRTHALSHRPRSVAAALVGHYGAAAALTLARNSFRTLPWTSLTVEDLADNSDSGLHVRQ